MHLRGGDRIEVQLAAAAAATKKRYLPYLVEIFDGAEKRGIPIVAVNLPFAYGHHYGKHLSELCAERPDVCVYDLSMEFSQPQEIADRYRLKPLPNPKDFVDLTAVQMGMSSEDLAQIFEARPFFHDVCHLSPLGHAAVADALIEPIHRALP